MRRGGAAGGGIAQGWRRGGCTGVAQQAVWQLLSLWRAGVETGQVPRRQLHACLCACLRALALACCAAAAVTGAFFCVAAPARRVLEFCRDEPAGLWLAFAPEQAQQPAHQGRA